MAATRTTMVEEREMSEREQSAEKRTYRGTVTYSVEVEATSELGAKRKMLTALMRELCFSSTNPGELKIEVYPWNPYLG